ncbi:unnamed protein product [Gordionus sp. m RMFG-2023]
MAKPQTRGTAFLITVSSAPTKLFTIFCGEPRVRGSLKPINYALGILTFGVSIAISKAYSAMAKPQTRGTAFLITGFARTQIPTTRNYALELPTFGVIVAFNSTNSAMAKPPTKGTAFMITVTLAPGNYSSTKRRKLDILNNTLEAEGLEEPVRDNSPNTSASYQNTLEDECLEESERDVNHIISASYQNTLEDECLEESEGDVNHDMVFQQI